MQICLILWIKTLRKISGKVLKIYSGVAIIDASTGKELVDYELTKVKMRKMSKKDIEQYVATGEPLDKAEHLQYREGVQYSSRNLKVVTRMLSDFRFIN